MLTLHLPTFPVLTTERLVLRELRSSDAAPVFAMRSDPRVMQHVLRPLATTLADATALIDLIGSRLAANDAVQWAMTRKGDDTLIGLIGFWRIAKEHHLAELGYMLAHAHWGQGLMSEAVGTVVDFGFRTLGFHRIEAVTGPRNAGSIRVLEKGGFVREGHFRENVLSNGVFLDSLYFGQVAGKVSG